MPPSPRSLPDRGRACAIRCRGPRRRSRAATMPLVGWPMRQAADRPNLAPIGPHRLKDRRLLPAHRSYRSRVWQVRATPPAVRSIGSAQCQPARPTANSPDPVAGAFLRQKNSRRGRWPLAWHGAQRGPDAPSRPATTTNGSAFSQLPPAMPRPRHRPAEW